MRVLTKTKQHLSSKFFHLGLGLSLLVLFAPTFVYAAPAPECQNTDTQAKLEKCIEDNKLVDMLGNIVNFLSAGIGVVVVIMIIIGGIQYITAGDNPSAVTAAKQRIGNALLALVIFLFTFAFLQWLIPGGVFERP